MRLIYGVGFNDRKHPVRENGIHIKEYALWFAMMARCYSEAAQKNQKSYIGCEVSENFKSYSYFYEWCQNQAGFNQKGFELDKDLLAKGNREYHPNKYVFIPKEINSSLKTSSKSRGDLPIGVCKDKGGGFKAQLRNWVGRKHLGTFPAPELAFQAYKAAKEQAIKDMANKWKDQIDPCAYDALIAYQVEITD